MFYRIVHSLTHVQRLLKRVWEKTSILYFSRWHRIQSGGCHFKNGILEKVPEIRRLANHSPCWLLFIRRAIRIGLSIRNGFGQEILSGRLFFRNPVGSDFLTETVSDREFHPRGFYGKFGRIKFLMCFRQSIQSDGVLFREICHLEVFICNCF